MSAMTLGCEVLKVLGIEARRVIGVSIDMDAGKPPTVTVRRLVIDDVEAGKLAEVLERYEIQAKPEDPAASALETVARNLLRG